MQSKEDQKLKQSINYCVHFYPIRCAENHWKIASGEGCEACDCDPVGSTNTSCILYDGQCDCKDGFGGRRCDQCVENHWGDPRVQCYPCDCNPQGSQSFQCNPKTGECECLEGTEGSGHIIVGGHDMITFMEVNDFFTGARDD